MFIEYRGRNIEKGINYRCANMWYDAKKEQEKADKIFKILRDIGWEILEEEEVGWIIVYDKEEYQEVLEDYKKAKKMLRCK